jgi:hypothetical protein
MLWKLNFITSWVSNSITEFERKIENENNSWKWSLIGQGRHLVLEMSTSEMAHAERERENTPVNNNKVKPEQLKLSKTYLST